ncbi:adenylate kinase [Acrasis kona]|uniref:Adenylate kinase n=1 Tax=Acrasis kona TaxID=1008807 RepID=A0AAW2Z1T5_9EUKA
MSTTPQHTYRHCIFLGQPGAGMSTAAHTLCKKIGMTYLSVSQLLEMVIEGDSQTAATVRSHLNSSKIITDQLFVQSIVEVIKSGKCRNGFILDGLPKNISQAKLLDEMLQNTNIRIDAVFNFRVSDEQLLINRMRNSLIHQTSGRIYDLSRKSPKHAGKDDETGQELCHRYTLQNTEKRLCLYKLFSEPLLKHYAHKLIQVDADKPITHVCKILLQYLPKPRPWYSPFGLLDTKTNWIRIMLAMLSIVTYIFINRTLL